MRNYYLVDIIIFLSVFFLGVYLGYWLNDDQNPYVVSKVSNNTVNGLYFENFGYFVFTEGRTEKEIIGTHCHEVCHDLVFKNNTHFCGQEATKPQSIK